MAIIVTRATSALVSGTGTITTSTSSTTVTGSGTLFTTEVDYAGKALYTSGDVYIGTISSITNNTTIVLTANAAVAVSAGAYKFGYLPKNAPLSNLEIDTNFINLNNNKLEITDASPVNLANTVVRRDGSGNFAAGTITATLSNSISAGTGLSGTAYNGSAPQTWTLATSGVTAGNYGSATAIPVLSIDTYGRITSASTTTVSTTISLAAGSGSGSVSGGGTLTLTGGTGVTTSASGSTYTISLPQAVGTSSNVQFGSLGVGAAASGTSGSITCTSLTETSSITLKENINSIDNALQSILSLNGVTYDRKDGTSKNEAGLIAEDVNKVLPNLVSKDEQGNPLGINYTKLSAYLIEAVKSLKDEIDSLKGSK